MLNALAKTTRVFELVGFIGQTIRAIHREVRPPSNAIELSKREIVILRLALLRSGEYLKSRPESASECEECSTLSDKLWASYGKFD